MEDPKKDKTWLDRLLGLRRENRRAFHDNHRPGNIIRMNYGANYRIAKDGSYRRIQ